MPNTMAHGDNLVRVAITQIPDIHFFPNWDRQFQVEYPYVLDVERVNSEGAHALLAGDAGVPYDIAIVAEEPTLAQYPQGAYQRVVVAADTFSLVVSADDRDERILALREAAPYVKQRQLVDLLCGLESHELLLRGPGAGMVVYITEHLLGGRAASGRVGPRGCKLAEEERPLEGLVGGLLDKPRRLSIVPNSVLRDVTVPRDRVVVLPIIHAPLRLFFMLRRRESERSATHREAVDTLWDFLLDFIGVHRERSQLGADRAPDSPRSQALLLGIDVVDFSLMPEEHQRTAVRLLNSITQQVVAAVEPVRRRIRTAISTGDGLILVIDGDVDPTALFDATVGLNMALNDLLDTLGRSLETPGGMAARMALHAGPVLTVYDPSGDLNFVGPGVNDLQRTLEFGTARQVLASATAYEYLSSAAGFVDDPDARWTGWDKHGIAHELHSLWGQGYGSNASPARLDLRRTPQ